jgi:putative transcriptional regulator
MAIRRMSLAEIAAAPSSMDVARVTATSAAEIRRQMREDGTDAPLRKADLLSPAEIRKGLGMSQPVFARLLQVPVATLRNWEQNRVAMEPAVLALMRILAREPKAAMRALQAGS